MSTGQKHKVKMYTSLKEFDEAIAKEEAEGWIPIHHTHVYDAKRLGHTFTVTYRKWHTPEVFSSKAIERLMAEGDAEEQAFASALLMDQWFR